MVPFSQSICFLLSIIQLVSSSPRQRYVPNLHGRPPMLNPLSDAEMAAKPAVESPDRDTMKSPFGDDEPTCDLPMYDLPTWIAKNGNELPDHPAVFKAHPLTTFNISAFDRYKDGASFEREFGHEVLRSEPGYAQAGGHLKYLNVPSNVGKTWTVSELMSQWEGTYRGHYMSEFNCYTKFCARFVKSVSVPRFFGESTPVSTNFLIGGPGSGLPIHRHSKTYQMQLAGAKVWYLMPPDHLSVKMAEEVGPFLYPPEAWAGAMKGRPLGERPLRCVQYPGEIIYFPDHWWHGTMNVGDFNLAYGEKPSAPVKKAPPSKALQNIIKPFEQFPLTGSSCTKKNEDIPWFDIICHIGERRTDRINVLSHPSWVMYNHTMAARAQPDQYSLREVDLLGETASFSFCLVRSLAAKDTALTNAPSFRQTMQIWADAAKAMSAKIWALQCDKTL